MDRAELREQWHENNDRPHWVRAHRDDLHEHTDTSEPIPSGGVAAVADWLSRYKATVTTQLKPGDPDADAEAEA